MRFADRHSGQAVRPGSAQQAGGDARATRRRHAGLLFAVVIAVITLSTVAAQSQVGYLYTLANFDGPLRYDGVRVSVDRDAQETYVVYQNLIHIFNASGMEVFRFGENLELGQILDVAIDRNGDMLLLSFKDEHSLVTRCNYRGVPMAEMTITRLPSGVVFSASRVIRRDDLLYFVSYSTSRVIITTTSGEYRSHVDLQHVIDSGESKEEKDKEANREAGGFAVDQDGALYVTVPTLFRVVKRAADGTVTAFGASGSAPGKFGVIAGIAVDAHGNLFIADKLKCVILVFDKAFNFITEFGYRGARPENLIVPDDVASDGHDRVYVSQWRRRGVSVFSFTSR